MKMTFENVLQQVTALKREYGRLLTNIVPGAMNRELEYELLREGAGIVVIAHEPYRKRGYFATKDEITLIGLLQGLPENIVFEWIYRDENVLEEIMEKAGIELYATYIRHTCVWDENPYETQARGNALLQELYEPDCGEYARMSDAKELCELSKSVFDVNCDDVFTVEEWQEIIARKEVLVYRENNKILSCYVWRLEGNKLYSNISINLGPANILYNLERRVLEEMWDKGVRVTCAWRNMRNKKAVQRMGDLPERTQIMYNAIYKTGASD
ncbi:MAG: hypothetical protein J1F22_04700 [Lachnospiraceae bacterium]|nr:hypothetical protein [Lachnospiraceae bacterium]